MVRIYAVLAITAVLLLAVALMFGLSLENASTSTADASMHKMTIHRMLGVFTAIFITLVHSIGITYFVGTSRWCKEVVQTYSLDVNLYNRCYVLKRKAFPWAITGFFIMLGIIALGASSDSSTGLENAPSRITFHFLAACCGSVLIGFTYFTVWTKIVENQAVIEEILGNVAKIRREKGLDEAETAKSP